MTVNPNISRYIGRCFDDDFMQHYNIIKHQNIVTVVTEPLHCIGRYFVPCIGVKFPIYRIVLCATINN